MSLAGVPAGVAVVPPLAALAELRSAMTALSDATDLSRVHPDRRAGATNFLHYLALRRRDLRELQSQLRELGLSTLGRSEACVLPTVDAVLSAVRAIAGEAPASASAGDASRTMAAADASLAAHADLLFGPAAGGRPVRIMVTLPSRAGDAPELVSELLDAGMDTARINAAHDEPDDWAAMATAVHAASALGGRSCRVLVDLPGPKLRTAEPPDERKPPRVFAGDRVWLAEPGVDPADLPGKSPRCVGCSLPGALAGVQPGDRVVIDDGRVWGRAAERRAGAVLIEIASAPEDGARLKPDKGINLPDSPVHIAGWTDADDEALAFAIEHADMVALSFVRTPADVRALADRLEALPPRAVPLGVVLKVETRQAFERLPEILLELMRFPRAGVMIARGDLAVEIGYERLAEVQEELLWLAEAAHLPVVWATQVLESLAKAGRATRAEITDAAMSIRAECVMLNKGPHIVEAVRTLDDILTRMAPHQLKKRAMLRKLQVAEAFASRPS